MNDKKFIIINKFATGEEMLKMYKDKSLPTAIVLTEEEKEIFGDSYKLFNNLYRQLFKIGNYENAYLLLPNLMIKQRIKPTKLIIDESESYPIKELVEGDDDINLGGFVVKKKGEEDDKKYFSMFSLCSMIEQKIKEEQQLGETHKR